MIRDGVRLIRAIKKTKRNEDNRLARGDSFDEIRIMNCVSGSCSQHRGVGWFPPISEAAIPAAGLCDSRWYQNVRCDDTMMQEIFTLLELRLFL